MNVINGEVFAVVPAILVVGLVLPFAAVIRPEVVEPFTAPGLLDPNCRIGRYLVEVSLGDDMELCVYIHNQMGYPVLAQVK